MLQTESLFMKEVLCLMRDRALSQVCLYSAVVIAHYGHSSVNHRAAHSPDFQGTFWILKSILCLYNFLTNFHVWSSS